MADGLGITLVSVGGILVYAGVKGYSVPDVIRNVVVGRPIGENVRIKPAGSQQGGTTPPNPNAVPDPGSRPTPSGPLLSPGG